MCTHATTCHTCNTCHQTTTEALHVAAQPAPPPTSQGSHRKVGAPAVGAGGACTPGPEGAAAAARAAWLLAAGPGAGGTAVPTSTCCSSGASMTCSPSAPRRPCLPPNPISLPASSAGASLLVRLRFCGGASCVCGGSCSWRAGLAAASKRPPNGASSAVRLSPALHVPAGQGRAGQQAWHRCAHWPHNRACPSDPAYALIQPMPSAQQRSTLECRPPPVSCPCRVPRGTAC